MISPESQGKFLAGSVDLRLSSVKQDRLEFTGNDVKHPFSGKSDVYRLSGLLDLGIVNRLDFLYLGHMSGTTVGIYGLKVQVLGKNRQEAKQGNFSVSLAGGTGRTGSSFDTSDNDLNNWTTNVDKLSWRVQHHEAGLVAGYRWANKLLHYVNAFYFHENLRGKVTTDGNTLQDAKFRDTQDGMIYSTGLLYDLGANWYLKADFSHMTAKWSSFHGTTSNTFNGGIGAQW